MIANRMKALFAAGRPAFGTWVHFSRSPAIARMIAAAGYDYVFVDQEHSNLPLDVVGDICEMARACGITPVVRSRNQDPTAAGLLLDAGAMGLMFHDVRTRDQVDALVAAIRYPPEGERGSMAGAAAHDYQTSGDAAADNRFLNENTLLSIQIESPEGIEALDDMLAPGGVDLVEIGRNDLSTSLGHPRQVRHPEVLAAVDRIIAGGNRHGVAVGTLALSPDDARDMLARGMRSIVYGGDRSILMKAYRESVALLHEAAGREAD